MDGLFPSLLLLLLLFVPSQIQSLAPAPICAWPPKVSQAANMQCYFLHGKPHPKYRNIMMIIFNRSDLLNVSLETNEIERRLSKSDGATCCFDRSARDCYEINRIEKPYIIRPNWKFGQPMNISQDRCCEIFTSMNVLRMYKKAETGDLARIDLAAALSKKRPKTTVSTVESSTSPTVSSTEQRPLVTVPTAESSEGRDLGWEMIAGIVAATLLLLILIVSIVVACCIKRRRDRLHVLDIERRFSEGGAAYAGLREGPGRLT